MDPCNVCGGKDMNLVDGYYYCVECGTQDVNVQETVVEQAAIGDGTFAYTTSKRITAVVEDGIEMSSEWHKWHTFNFILVGLTDELIGLGAKPTLKMKVLWIWSRYIKRFQVKNELTPKNRLEIENDEDTVKGASDNENDSENRCNNESDEELRNKSTKLKSDKVIRNIKVITRGTILTILYVALNLDRSDIQLSHLFRFIREGHLSLYNCMKYVPQELKMKAVKNYKSFILSQREHNPKSIRELGLTFFKTLKLGVPLVPDMRKLVNNFICELCLPNDIKHLVFALMHFMPVEFLDIDAKTQKSLVRMPDYEGICMAYILVALKICFGLDDDYEIRISEVVDKINDEENYLKSYKLGLFSEPCDRLFSFKEWCQHLQFRRFMLCKNYLPIAQQYNDITHDSVFMEHLEKRKEREMKLSDDVTMDILNKIKSDQEFQIIPKTDFPVTLTPMSTYLDVLAQHVQDPDIRLLLCEDFRQYSIKYAIRDFKLSKHLDDIDNPIVGVSELGKIFNKCVVGTLTVQEGDSNMVYVRDCQNKNWLKTNPPKMQHVTKNSNENNNDKDSDHGYDSNMDNSTPERDDSHFAFSDDNVYEEDKLLEVIDDIDSSACIFDDNFLNVPEVASKKPKEECLDNCFEIITQNNINIQDSTFDSFDNIESSKVKEVAAIQFNPEVFDREKMIKELIELACNNCKISIPKDYSVKKQNKRKVTLTHNEVLSIEPKKKRTVNRSKPGEAQRVVNNFIFAYYNKLHNDIFNEVSQQVKSIIEIEDNLYNLDTANVLVNENEINNSITSDQNEIHHSDSLYLGENEKSLTKTGIYDSATKNDRSLTNSIEKNLDTVIMNENVEEINHELIPKSDPNFDEKEYDIRQLYLKLGKDINMDRLSIVDVSNDPEIDKIIQKQLEFYSNNGISTVSPQKNNNVTDKPDDSSESEDDFPLSILKEISSNELEKKKKKEETLEPFIRDPSNVKTLMYWVRHYKSVYVVKSKDIGQKFNLELDENLPKSFVFVIRECAALLGCSVFSLYKNMQNIEEILIANVH